MFFKGVKVMKIEENLRKCSILKITKETKQTTFFAINNIIGTIGKVWSLKIRWWKCTNINFLILMVELWLYRKCSHMEKEFARHQIATHPHLVFERSIFCSVLQLLCKFEIIYTHTQEWHLNIVLSSSNTFHSLKYII